MQRRHFLLTLALGAASLGAGPAARGDHSRYRGYRYHPGRGRDEIRRREILRLRLFDLGDRTALAERNRDISRRDADDIYRRLDRVCNFLRDDRYLTESEFHRRRDDLDDAEDELRDALRHRRGHRYDGGRRYRY